MLADSLSDTEALIDSEVLNEPETEALVLTDSPSDVDSLNETEALTDAETEVETD